MQPVFQVYTLPKCIYDSANAHEMAHHAILEARIDILFNKNNVAKVNKIILLGLKINTLFIRFMWINFNWKFIADCYKPSKGRCHKHLYWFAIKRYFLNLLFSFLLLALLYTSVLPHLWYYRSFPHNITLPKMLYPTCSATLDGDCMALGYFSLLISHKFWNT